MRRGVGLAQISTLAGLALLVAGCAETQRASHIPPPPTPPPPGYYPRATGAAENPAPTANAPQADRVAPVRVQSSHRQYFDQRRKRYYFYDPARRAYFWEDGTPKGG